jgi:ATP-dependent exoDNAse (exonuclease V) beta subunit
MRDERGVIRKIDLFEIVRTVKSDRNWGNWAILCRTNKKVSDIMALLKRNDIPVITFRQAQGGLNELKEKMDSDAVKVLTIHSAKGLEFDKVIVCDMYTKGEENLRLNYVAVTRARDELYLCI